VVCSDIAGSKKSVSAPKVREVFKRLKATGIGLKEEKDPIDSPYLAP